MKSISFSIKFLLLTFILGLVIFYILPVDEFGARCGSKSFIPLIVIILMVFLPLIVAIIEKIRKKISVITFIAILIVLMLVFLIIGLVFLSGGNRCVPDWKTTISNMQQLRIAQQIFYEQNNQYAKTQQELIEADILVGKLKNKTTNKEFIDKDGNGIDGGDNNSQTWSARTYVEYKEFNAWCIQKDKGYLYICNQNGCQKEY